MDNFYFLVTVGLLWVFLISMSFQLLVAEEKPMRHYEVCRAKLFTHYPYEVNQNEWRSCMEVRNG